MEFEPMMHDAGSVTAAELHRAREQGRILLGFNEPDRSDQAHMAVKEALGLWPRLESTGMRLSAPAVATGGDVAGGWLDRFMKGATARDYKVDFIPLHWYGADFDATRATAQLRSYLQAVHQRHKKPIWLTEYALIDFTNGTPRYPTKAQQATFVKKSTAMLQCSVSPPAQNLGSTLGLWPIEHFQRDHLSGDSSGALASRTCRGASQLKASVMQSARQSAAS
ncbi:glycosyl hydrolase [Streptomyces chartreusis]|uniref:glycosyl hydrolase n=1 Tax=Streptomyces chartreusis TaxID=1969 RepID=UPI00227D82D0|nr:glycosyl hydrolase [Streptomyces chartreusis]